MNLQMVKEQNLIVAEHVSGSHLYGLNVATSDRDIKGVFRYPLKQMLSLKSLPQEVSQTEDIKYYELRKFMDLLCTCNPTVMDTLWVPNDAITIDSAIYRRLRENRHLFVSQKAFHTFSGYAYAQIKKAKGQNKMVHNPQLAIKPVKEDFCWLLSLNPDDNGFFMRPKKLKEWGVDLAEYHAAGLEHVSGVYRLYHYGESAKGVFRGDDMLVCESIPMEDENERFDCLLIYNQNEFEKALNEHRKYNDWIANRNDARWVDQENGLLNYDQKNMMHCMRLLMSGINILTKGEPIIRFEGEAHDYLMKIRRGEFKYEEIMARADELMAEMERVKGDALPHSINLDKVDELYQELVWS